MKSRSVAKGFVCLGQLRWLVALSKRRGRYFGLHVELMGTGCSCGIGGSGGRCARCGDTHSRSPASHSSRPRPRFAEMPPCTHFLLFLWMAILAKSFLLHVSRASCATSSADSTLRVWELNTGTEVSSRQTPTDDRIYCLSAFPTVTAGSEVDFFGFKHAP